MLMRERKLQRVLKARGNIIIIRHSHLCNGSLPVWRSSPQTYCTYAQWQEFDTPIHMPNAAELQIILKMNYSENKFYAMDRRGAFQGGFGSGSTGSFDSHGSVDRTEKWFRFESNYF
ncbi:unnamed protein product [Onchocerca flexuosa]|uniref:TLDc domain-containing protein n=1 Tax=Onchocerca flexuosa TaxID=387005 RepID=A0A183GYR2_9BILA|nr:unnamed protein product [Onchocerca flexuosa]